MNKATLHFIGQAIVLGLLVATVLLWLFPGLRMSPSVIDNRVALPPTPIYSYREAVSQAAPAVVNIFTASMQTPLQSGTPSSLGSGVIINPQGFILTNFHVIEDASAIAVALKDGRTTEQVTVIGTDPETDLAVLHIPLNNLPFIQIADSANTHVGDVVLAIGNPYGIGQTVSQGIISALGRSGLGLTTYEHFIQTDAAINRGNSGGALVNSLGELVGINSAMISKHGGNEGIALAIPSVMALSIMDSIIKYGRVIRGWLGVEAANITRQQAGKIAQTQLPGVLVTGIENNSPAAHAGLQLNDWLVAINQQPIDGVQKAMQIIASLRPGTPISMTVIRHGQKLELSTSIGLRPPAELIK